MPKNTVCSFYVEVGNLHAIGPKGRILLYCFYSYGTIAIITVIVCDHAVTVACLSTRDKGIPISLGKRQRALLHKKTKSFHRDSLKGH
jgi:hypothetical protein